MRRQCLNRVGIVVLLAVAVPAGAALAQAGMPPPEIQAILEKQQSGKQITEDEAKALVAWGQSLTQMMQGALGEKAGASPPAAAFRAGDAETATNPFDGRAMWDQELWPVFSHPRCLNCHGIVNPLTGENHGGGKVPGIIVDPEGRPLSSCWRCHTANLDTNDDGTLRPTNQPWVLAPEDVWFKGLSSTQLCGRMSRKVRASPEEFFEHIQNDLRVQLSFVGLRGMDDRSDAWEVVQPAEPPPMTHEQFLVALRKWSKLGAASCGWTGTISYVRKEIRDEQLPTGPLHEESKVEAELDVTGNQAKGVARFVGSSTAPGPAYLDCTLVAPAGMKVALPIVGGTQITKTESSGSANGTGVIRVVRMPDGRYSIAIPIFPIPVSNTTKRGAPDRPGPPVSSAAARCSPSGGSETDQDVHGKSSGSVRGSTSPTADRLTGSMDKTTTDPDGTTLTITASWDLRDAAAR